MQYHICEDQEHSIYENYMLDFLFFIWLHNMDFIIRPNPIPMPSLALEPHLRFC